MDENLPMNKRNQHDKSLHRGIRLRMMIAIPALIVLTPLIPIALFQLFNVDLIQILLNAKVKESLIVAILGTGLFADIVAGLVVAQTILSPLKRLERLGKVLASGGEVASEELSNLTNAPGEIGEIGISFADSLKKIGQLSNVRTRRIMDSLGSGVLVLNPAGQVSVMNRTAGDMLEVNEDACTTSGMLQTDVFKKHQALRTLVDKATAASKIETEEIIPMLCADRLRACAEEHTAMLPPMDKVLVKISRLIAHNGQIQGYLMVLTDLTRQEMFLKQIQFTEALAMLGTFASGLAHEIKNPLTTIRLRQELLFEEIAAAADIIPAPMAESLREHLNTINTQTHRLDALVNDVRDYVRMSRQTSVEEKTVFNLLDVVMDTVDESRQRIVTSTGYAPEHKPDILVDFHNLTSVPMCGSADRMRQVIQNLLNNAVRHAPDDGLVQVHVELSSGDGSGMMPLPIVVRVINNGAHIPEEDLHRLFHPFFTTTPTGTGIGLPISQMIVRAHGGVITHENLNIGVEFTVRLPKTVPESE